MNRLLILLASLTGVGLSLILTPPLGERDSQFRIVREIETLLNQAQFSDLEFAWLDQLSQRFPQSANAFHKLYALEKMNPSFSPEEYQALRRKYLARFAENQRQAQLLIQYVENSTFKSYQLEPFKTLAARMKSESELKQEPSL